ncbi:hypothetical protein PAXINDRAFT_16414 [Paxillus involutus ATCC 200175]|uniref:Uncharacterized protein n=1 Tax=Paxillus involutus ATCC 200175 TaxID=664439 RepID=A0A0C9T4I8_PAXIN|nr:hypothetical protein PAXINDRAFT_16414 [Paxillus involutus ATCC 200175]
MSLRNTTLARIMQMGDKITVEPSSNPDLAGINLLTKIMVKLTKALPKGPGKEVLPVWVNMWMLTALETCMDDICGSRELQFPTAKILFMFARHAEGQGHKAWMLMHDAKVIAGGEVKCTGLLVEWEAHGRTGGREWEMLINKELVNLKASMDTILGKTEEAGVLLDRKLVYPESKWCSWCYTEAHRELI